MSIKSLTKERMETLLNQIKNKKGVLDSLKASTAAELWSQDLMDLKL